MRLICLLILAGCTYHPGSFTTLLGKPFRGVTTTVGCIELGVASSSDDRATGPVVEYAFGNRCDHHVTVDLASIRVVAHERTLRLFDPNHEVKPGNLDALAQGTERLEYLDPDLRPVTSLCVDVGGIETDVPHQPRWICVEAS